MLAAEGFRFDIHLFMNRTRTGTGMTWKVLLGFEIIYRLGNRKAGVVFGGG